MHTPSLEEHGIGCVLSSQAEPQLSALTSSVAAPKAYRKGRDLSCSSTPLVRTPVSPGLDRDCPTEHEMVGSQAMAVLVSGLLLQELCYLWLRVSGSELGV